MKPLDFTYSQRDFKRLPADAQRALLVELTAVAEGLEPRDSKHLKGVGAGVQEIRVRTRDGAFRAAYVVKFADAVYVLHVFEKKTEKTTQRDLERIRERYRDLLAQRE